MAPGRRKGASKAAAAAAARRQWKIGDLVLAKLKGFPAWPATVSEPEKWGYSFDWKKVLVYFFGTQQIAFCNPADVEAFTEEKKESLLVKRQGKGADFVRAVQEIIDSYEKSKMQGKVDDIQSGDEATTKNNDNSLGGLSKSIGLKEQTETVTEAIDSKLQTSHSTEHKSQPSVDVDDAQAAKNVDFFHARDTSFEEPTGSVVVKGTPKIATYSSRKRSGGLHVQSCMKQGKTPSIRRSRSSSRGESSRFQNLARPYNNGVIAAIATRTGSLRRNKRLRKSPDTSESRDLGSSALVSNNSTEDNSSEIVTADSDSFSLNEGSSMESGCNHEHSEPVECLERGAELSKGLDLQLKAVINKKKRRPSRKRVSNEVPDLTRLCKDAISDPGVGDMNHTSHNSCERLNEKDPKEDGDEHLPLVKRARVRMGKPPPFEEELNSSLQMEEKPLEEASANSSEQVIASFNCRSDNSADKNLVEMKETIGDISPPRSCPHLPENELQHWKSKTNQSYGCSADGEAALPLSKRLHRALEAMSENAAEEGRLSVETSATTNSKVNGCSASPVNGCPHVDMETEVVNVLGPEDPDLLCNPVSHAGASGHSTALKLEAPEETTNLLGVGICGQPSEDLKDPKHELGKYVLDVAMDPIDENSIGGGTSFGCPAMQSVVQIQNTGHFLPTESSLHKSLPSKTNSNEEKTELSNSTANHHRISEHPEADEIVKDSARNSVQSNNCGTEGDDGMNLSSKSQVAGNYQIDGSSEVSNRVEHKGNHTDTSSISDDHMSEKSVFAIQSSPLPNGGVDFLLRQTPPVVEGKSESAFCHRPRLGGQCSNHAETHAALASFEAMLGTLTRTKESIGRATRIAMDCAKLGVAIKVAEIVARNLESESSLHKRVDLFFLVDSIAQCSRGFKGDLSGVFPLAIQSLLPRLLSAVAPPGHETHENRRQCLKVLRLWLERRILPESIIRHHIRELNSCGSSASAGAYSRRSARTERSLDDPIREMEGMLVDEYGSNSSFQLPGLCMPRMLKDEEEGSDSDGESFEAVTPEHNLGSPEELEITRSTDKHRHILEDVDGELEMEDVAPCTVDASSISIAGVRTGQTSRNHIEQNFVPYAPPLPQDVPPSSPPLPSSPPPRSLPPPCAVPNTYINDIDSTLNPSILNMQEHLQQSGDGLSVATRSNTATSELHFHAPGHRDSHIQLHMTDTTTSFGSFLVQPANTVQMERARCHDKAYPPMPPHPVQSSQFSYVQADQHVNIRREVPPPSFSNRRDFIQNTGSGDYYNNHDRMKPVPYDRRESWRHHAPPFSAKLPYPPAPYTGRQCESARLPNEVWAPPPNWRMDNRNSMVRPPSDGPYPVAVRGPNFWRPR